MALMLCTLLTLKLAVFGNFVSLSFSFIAIYVHSRLRKNNCLVLICMDDKLSCFSWFKHLSRIHDVIESYPNHARHLHCDLWCVALDCLSP